MRTTNSSVSDRKSTRLNSSHTEIYTLSLHDALPIFGPDQSIGDVLALVEQRGFAFRTFPVVDAHDKLLGLRSEEHTSELQSHRDLHSFPTRRSSDLRPRPVHRRRAGLGGATGFRVSHFPSGGCARQTPRS